MSVSVTQAFPLPEHVLENIIWSHSHPASDLLPQATLDFVLMLSPSPGAVGYLVLGDGTGKIEVSRH